MLGYVDEVAVGMRVAVAGIDQLYIQADGIHGFDY
jgi:hypothetical protein